MACGIGVVLVLTSFSSVSSGVSIVGFGWVGVCWVGAGRWCISRFVFYGPVGAMGHLSSWCFLLGVVVGLADCVWVDYV